MTESPSSSYPATHDAYRATRAIPGGEGSEPDGPPAGGLSPSGEPLGEDQRATDAAKDQAAQVSRGAVEAGQHVVAVAKDQAGNVADEAARRATDLLAQARNELSLQAGQQQQRIAEGLRVLGEELHAMTQHDGPSGVATDLAQQGARRSREMASWLQQREPDQLVRELRTFARHRPGSFLLLAAGIGLAAGRLTRGVTDAAGEAAATATSTDRRAAPRVPPFRPSAAAATPVSSTATPGVSHAAAGAGEYGSATLSSVTAPGGGAL
jgi:hypothetical protein